MTDLKTAFYAMGLALASLMTQAAEPPPVQVAVNVDAQPVRAALREFSAQSGVQVLLRVDNISVEGVLASKVEGELTAQAALTRLLQNTGLTYEFINDRTVRVSAIAGPPPEVNSADKEGKSPAPVTQARNERMQGDTPLPDPVTISATRPLDEHTLDRIVVPEFVQLRGIASTRIDQLGRWQSSICPETRGLPAPSSELVSRRVLTLAREVGAPTQRAGRCRTNVEILFTGNPAQELSYVAKNEPELLGYPPGGRNALTSFDGPIKAWYATRTRSYAVISSDVGDPQLGLLTPVSPDAALPPPLQSPIDAPGDLVRGMGGSHLKNGIVSEFVNVLIVVDRNQVSGDSLAEIADYVAMLALTRTSVRGCSPLPSVIDLLSPDCGSQAKPHGLTAADTAYLKALYASDLEAKASLARGEIHDRMLRQIVGR
jgi:hypothetical protein